MFRSTFPTKPLRSEQPSVRTGVERLIRALVTQERVRETCPFCGTTRADYESSKLFGCPLCTDLFTSERANSSPHTSIQVRLDPAD